jgi:hypothetical protein
LISLLLFHRCLEECRSGVQSVPFKRAKGDQVEAIVKAREPARILTAIGEGICWHLLFAWRWITQYNFYLCDQFWGRMFVRVCPYLPFSARGCLNQHHWLANKLCAEGIDFEQRSNAFLRCGQPQDSRRWPIP